MAEVELHDEVAEWMDSLDDAEWDRTVVVIDRLAAFGSAARMPLSKSLGDRAVRAAVHARLDGTTDHLRARKVAEACAAQYP